MSIPTRKLCVPYDKLICVAEFPSSFRSRGEELELSCTLLTRAASD